MGAPRTDEFHELLPVGALTDKERARWTRRSFFRVMGLSSAAAAAACSRAPVTKIVPFLEQPDEIVPGVPLRYASTCGTCPSACGVLLETRDGRPIKVEGNDLHPISKGGVCAVGQASVLSLYDSGRAPGPFRGGSRVSWEDLDREVGSALGRMATDGKAIRLVTPPRLGPTGEAAVARFLAAFPTARRVRHDPLRTDVVALAHERTHGVRAIPAYRFDRAAVVVSFGADFLGTWIDPVAFTKGWRAMRDVAETGTMSRHFHVEPHLSLTGSNADVRWPLAPSEIVPTLAALARRLGVAVPEVAGSALSARRLDRLARELSDARGRSLVVCGSDDLAAQVLVNAIDDAVGAYGATIDLAAGVPLADAGTVDSLLHDLGRGDVGAVVFVGVNPVYDHPRGAALADRLRGVPLTVSTADRRDETGKVARFLAPAHHAMEDWNDAEPERGVLGLTQPVIRPLYETRSPIESLLTWAGEPKAMHELLRARWESEVFPRVAGAPSTFGAFWDRSLQNGLAVLAPDAAAPSTAMRTDAVAETLRGRTPPPAAALELVLHASVGIRDGRLANNGWLQELPDPISKVTWGNVAAIAPSTARRLGIEDGRILVVEAGGRRIRLPALLQRGVHPRVVAIAVGYGRDGAGEIADGVGASAWPLAGASLSGTSAQIRTTEASIELARTQTQDFLEGRPLAPEMDLAEALAGPAAEAREPESGSLWPRHAYPGHKWGMVVDLNACTGCSACLVACQAENNVAIVGEDEVRRRRELHWIRIDRYYGGTEDEPDVIHEPMMCQHCENAPCETVCPVLATVHSSEGLNQQVYNRCVGTRYCANNCPYKVRRFNWFEYEHGDDVQRMVLNPDVVVRSRGVMEKCSFCVQRIQAGKTAAKREGRALRDDDVRTACQESCPAGAIVFGDLNDRASRVAELAESGRGRRLLEELGVEPSVRYLPKVRNPGRPA